MNFDLIPIWVFLLATILVILLAMEAGYSMGRGAARRSADEKESPVAAIGGAVLGLVAFMLAFTFGIASQRFDDRKELVREEANAIRNAILLGDFLPDARQDEHRTLLRRYLDIRIDLVAPFDPQRLTSALTESNAIQARLWAMMVAHGKADNSDISAMMVESITSLEEIQARRLAIAVETRIPAAIWSSLFAISILGMMAMGYQSGIAGSKRSKTSLFMAISFAVVIALIAGLDRPNSPFIGVSQKPLIEVREWMDVPSGRPTTQPT